MRRWEKFPTPCGASLANTMRRRFYKVIMFLEFVGFIGSSGFIECVGFLECVGFSSDPISSIPPMHSTSLSTQSIQLTPETSSTQETLCLRLPLLPNLTRFPLNFALIPTLFTADCGNSILYKGQQVVIVLAAANR